MCHFKRPCPCLPALHWNTSHPCYTDHLFSNNLVYWRWYCPACGTPESPHGWFVPLRCQGAPVPRVWGFQGCTCVHAYIHHLRCRRKEHMGHLSCRAVGHWCGTRALTFHLCLSGLSEVFPLYLYYVYNKNRFVFKWHAVLWPLRD